VTGEPSENVGLLSLERFIFLMETPFDEVCRLLELDEPEPVSGAVAGMSVFLFDPQKDYVFAGAVIMDDEYGFYGIRVGSKWLEAAEQLEAQGFIQAGDAERFTLAGAPFGIAVHLYPDDYGHPASAKVHHYSVGPVYGGAASS